MPLSLGNITSFKRNMRMRARDVRRLRGIAHFILDNYAAHKRWRRGVFVSVVKLQAAINRLVVEHNSNSVEGS